MVAIIFVCSVVFSTTWVVWNPWRWSLNGLKVSFQKHSILYHPRPRHNTCKNGACGNIRFLHGWPDTEFLNIWCLLIKNVGCLVRNYAISQQVLILAIRCCCVWWTPTRVESTSSRPSVGGSKFCAWWLHTRFYVHFMRCTWKVKSAVKCTPPHSATDRV